MAYKKEDKLPKGKTSKGNTKKQSDKERKRKLKLAKRKLKIESIISKVKYVTTKIVMLAIVTSSCAAYYVFAPSDVPYTMSDLVTIQTASSQRTSIEIGFIKNIYREKYYGTNDYYAVVDTRFDHDEVVRIDYDIAWKAEKGDEVVLYYKTDIATEDTRLVSLGLCLHIEK